MSTKYEDRTRDELRKVAAEHDIEGRSRMSKDELIAALRADRMPAPKYNPGAGARIELHGLTPGEDAALHARTSSPVVVESPGPVLASQTVGEDGSVVFECAAGPYVVLCDGHVYEAVAKTEPAKPLPAGESGADVTVRGSRSTATRRL